MREAGYNAETEDPPMVTPGFRTRQDTTSSSLITWKPPATAEHVQLLIEAVAVLSQQVQDLQLAVGRIECKLDLD